MVICHSVEGDGGIGVLAIDGASATRLNGFPCTAGLAYGTPTGAIRPISSGDVSGSAMADQAMTYQQPRGIIDVDSPAVPIEIGGGRGYPI